MLAVFLLFFFFFLFFSSLALFPASSFFSFPHHLQLFPSLPCSSDHLFFSSFIFLEVIFQLFLLSHLFFFFFFFFFFTFFFFYNSSFNSYSSPLSSSSSPIRAFPALVLVFLLVFLLVFPLLLHLAQ